jgi:cell division septation protein DedD
MVAAACIALAAAAGAWATRYSVSQWWRRQPAVVLPAVNAKVQPAPARTNVDPPVPLAVIPPAPAAAAPATTPTVVLQVATFQSSTRTQQAIQELESAGFHAYSVELPPQDGERRLTVLLGPYMELAAAERDLDAARRLPGYDSARIVEAVPALLPPNAKP